MPPNCSTSRYSDQISFSFLVWMVFFAILVSAGGITYALLKNEQVAVRTEINSPSLPDAQPSALRRARNPSA